MNRKNLILLTSLSVVLGTNISVHAATNNRPVAVSDGVYAVLQGSTLVVGAPGVLANDSDADGETLTTVLVSGTAQGTLSLARDGSFSYRAPSSYAGEDGFSYVANDGRTVSLRALAKIKVVPPSGLPSVSIVSPQAGTANFAGDFNVIASASDSDGVVTNVQFFVDDVPSANAAAAPFCFSMNGMVSGIHRVMAIATDSDGLSTTSAPVVIEVITNGVTFTGEVTFNEQNGVFEQVVLVSNRTSQVWAGGVRLSVCNLGGTNRVLNASGISDGVPYLDNTDAVLPGDTQVFTVGYEVPDIHTLPRPACIAAPLPAYRHVQAPQITSITPANDGTVEVKFTSQPGNIYFLQCSEDFVQWKTDSTAIVASEASATALRRRTSANCFYRVLRAL